MYLLLRTKEGYVPLRDKGAMATPRALARLMAYALKESLPLQHNQGMSGKLPACPFLVSRHPPPRCAGSSTQHLKHRISKG
jgi:hypothetical protein